MNQFVSQAAVESLVIPRQLPEQIALNHEELYLAGLDYVRQYCGKIWTDYNVHDPGMTTLEMLSYVLTDIAYRASYPVQDLLATGINDSDLSSQFHSAAEVFSSNAITNNDYRKLVIDIPHIRNAWVQPVGMTLFADKSAERLFFKKPGGRKTESVPIEGLYRLLFDFSAQASAAEKNAAYAEAHKRVMAHRNLCEDWVPRTRARDTIKKQEFFLCGKIELEFDADVNEVYAEILYQVQKYLTPDVEQLDLAKMLALRHSDGGAYSTNEIFSGPFLENGFITDDALAAAELRTEIRLSDIISLVMEIDGVARVRKLHISPSEINEDQPVEWLVAVKSGHKPQLLTEDARLGFLFDDIPLVTSKQSVADHLQQKQAEQRRSRENIKSSDLPMPRGRKRTLADYYSVQNHFPAVYGISDIGLPAGASEADVNRARQFKSYLLFFDQVLANFTAQLVDLAKLFSSDPEITETYAFQLVDSFPEHKRVYALPNSAGEAQQNREQELKNAFVEEDAQLDRRNRFLDHLIARFGEQTTELAAALIKNFSTNAQTVVRYKCDFINNYPTISSLRGAAYNYSLSAPGDIWNTDNVSGLEKRLAALLGVENPQRRDLSEIPLDVGVEITSSGANSFRFKLRDQQNKVLLISPSQAFPSRAEAEQAVRRVLELATVSSNYQRRVNAAGKHFFELRDEEQVVARRSTRFDTPGELEAAIDEVIEFVRSHHSLEGMYLVENILLRPAEEDEPMMPICTDINCTDCSETDPYSYRLHVVLPAYAERFQSMEFRNHVEMVIRREMPAHILPKICWASRDDIAELESALASYLPVISGRTSAQKKQKLESLIKQLFSTKSVFPSERLVDCDEEETTSRFIVGRTTLGSFEPPEED